MRRSLSLLFAAALAAPAAALAPRPAVRSAPPARVPVTRGARALAAAGVRAAGAQWNPDGTLRALRGALAPAGPAESPEATARAFLRRHHDLFAAPSRAAAFALERVVEHPAGTTVRFRRQHGGIPVEPGSVAVHLGHDGGVAFVGSELTRAEFPRADAGVAGLFGLAEVDAVRAAAAAVGMAGEPLVPPTVRRVFRVAEGRGAPATEVLLVADEPLGDWLVTLDPSGRPLEVRDLIRYAHATVFRPNPVVTMRNPGLTDGDDAASAVPAAAYSQVELLGLDASGTLTGEFVSTENTKNRVHAADGEFHFDRSHKGFEEANLYYHLDFAQRYFQELGFDNVNNRVQKVDAHTNNADNSFYRPGTKHLYFGDGGVDDAEDAEIIWHEYGHSVQDNQVPGWGSGQAGAMGEAFGDFLGGAISEKMSDFQSACVGDWDGVSYSQDDPPCLRRLDADKRFPDDLGNGVHADGQIWSRGLWDIYNAFPSKDDAVRLVLAHHFLLSPGATMPEAAEALLAADQQLYAGAHQGVIKAAMVARGILEETAQVTVTLATAAGAPLGGVAVLAGAETIELAVAADTGTAAALVPPGAYTLTVRSFGYLPPPPVALDLAADDVAAERFALAPAPGGTLAGVVTGAGGAGVAATVRLLGTPLAPVVAGPDGAFSIDAPEGAYDLRVTAFGYEVATVTGATIPGPPLSVALAKLPPVLLVDDDSTVGGKVWEFEDYFEAALTASGHGAFKTLKGWEIGASPEDLLPYETVVWMTGGRTSSVLPAPQRAAVDAFLAAGGRLVFSGQDIAYAQKSNPWLTDRLGVVFAKDTSPDKTVAGAGLAFELGGDSAKNQKWPDVIAPAPGGQLWMRYGDGGGAGLIHDSGPGRVIFLSFGLEGVDGAATRTALMKACFEAGAPGARRRRAGAEWFRR